ncbi:SOS response-associated peptidase [Labrys monachus]|uniref:Abasic site processing protein n=1 Tax=Labrys monachus TaxID=217067 RepID=A0ABU0FB82_9HYPH|nr:SOS response-associated peptidase [Labrys monachus]MDQ0391696.1 putative SOS response-associated peptidase YedK [Labrys monachus]
MTGRFALTHPPSEVRDWFGYAEEPDFPPRYNIAPSQPVAVVHADFTARHFTLMRWGFIPGFIKDTSTYPLLINIRSETVQEKPSFRAAFMRRRCVLPADGFYQWQASGRARQPFLLRRPDRGLFALAAIWETWSGTDGSEIDTVGMLTTDANGTLAAVGERSPVIVPEDRLSFWLDPLTRPGDAAALLRPPSADFLELVRIGPHVNRADNDGPEIQQSA